MKVILIALALISSNVWAISKEDAGVLSEIFAKTIKENERRTNTGVAIAVFTADQIVMQKGFGLADVESKTPVTPHTSFAIGSTTKAFTSLGLKVLENRGVLKLTDKVTSHLPGFKLQNEKITEEATIEDLLSHRIGLPRHDLAWYLTDFTQEDLFSRLQYYSFPENAYEKFRKTFEYNNLMFMTAGKVIEESTGEKWNQFIQETFLNPLNMNETSFGTPKEGLLVATPYTKEKALPHKIISNVSAAGNMYSTISDMTKWIQSFMQKKWKGIDDLTTARIGLDNKNPNLNYGYALGWMVNSMNPKAKLIFHGGNIDGFTALVLFSDELNLGAVILINENDSDLNNLLIGDLVRYEFSKRVINKSFNPGKNFFLRFPKLDQITLMERTEMPSEKVRVYENPGYGILKTFSVDEKEYLSYYSYVWELKQIEDETFNYSFPLELAGEDLGEVPLIIKKDQVSVPLQSDVPLIDFILTNSSSPSTMRYDIIETSK